MRRGFAETELFAPVKEFLEHRGYEVSGEVRSCDVVARLEEELIVVELKRRINVQLLAQAVERQRYADGVYVAVPIESATKYPPNFRSLRRLLRRLEVGLLLVRFLRRGVRVELVFHPAEYTGRRSRAERRAVIREIEGRMVEGAPGGSASTAGAHLTAYKQAAIHIAFLLREFGDASPARLRALGGPERSQSILSNNHYGWFERVQRGVYRLTKHGEESLRGPSDRIGQIERAALEAARSVIEEEEPPGRAPR